MALFFDNTSLPGVPIWLHLVLLFLSLGTQLLPFIYDRSQAPNHDKTAPRDEEAAKLTAAIALMVTVFSVILTAVSLFMVGQWRAHTAEQQDGRERYEKVRQKLIGLPSQTYHSREQLQKLSVHELKALSDTFVPCCLRRRISDKSDLIEAILAAGGSSGTTCAICYEDYSDSDEMRVLPCTHRFHVKCVDKWLLSQAKKHEHRDVEAACPLCHKPV